MKSRTKQKSVSMSLRLPPDEAAALKKLAAAEGVSVSELIRKKLWQTMTLSAARSSRNTLRNA